MNTVGNYNPNEIVVESKINTLSMFQINFLYADKPDPPLLPDGIYYRPNKDVYVIQRKFNGELVYIGCNRDFNIALSLLVDFCKTHKLRI